MSFMTNEEQSKIRYLSIKYFDRKDKLERTIPTADVQDREQIADVYRTIMSLFGEGRISEPEARELKKTLATKYGFSPMSYFDTEHGLSGGLDKILDDLEDEEAA